jgi:hypothetical protein
MLLRVSWRLWAPRNRGAHRQPEGGRCRLTALSWRESYERLAGNHETAYGAAEELARRHSGGHQAFAAMAQAATGPKALDAKTKELIGLGPSRPPRQGPEGNRIRAND